MQGCFVIPGLPQVVLQGCTALLARVQSTGGVHLDQGRLSDRLGGAVPRPAVPARDGGPARAGAPPVAPSCDTQV